MISIRSAMAAGIIWSALMSATALADGREEYRGGIAAFKNKNFDKALQFFQQAEAEGYRTVTLFYNMGATHYRLGNYKASAEYFSRITNDAEWGPVAEYNLGLLAERQNKVDEAIEYYRRAYRNAESDKVKALAQRRLDALTDDQSARPVSDWTIYLSSAAGQDDNPALLQEGLEGLQAQSDTFLETIANANGYLGGNRSNGVRLNATLYDRRYSELNNFTLTGADLGLYWDTEGDAWRFSRGVRANSYWIGGNAYSSGASLVLQATQLNNTVNFDIKNDLGYISGADAYDFVNGLRNRFSVDLFQRWSGAEWRIGYRNEFNDRDDLLTADDQFFSYSPIRHSLYGKMRKDLSDNWSVTGRTEYRKSQYREENRELDSETGTFIERRREEDRVELSVALRYLITKSVSVFSEYRYTDNSASFDRFNYTSNEFMVGLDAAF